MAEQKKKLIRTITGSLADFITCSNCSKKIDWGQINGGDDTVYNQTDLCLDCHDKKESEKEIDEELKES